MTRHFVLLLAFVLTGNAHAQEHASMKGVNECFTLYVDSIEQRIRVYRWGTDTSYYLHYQVQNISEDTLTYITNTCFYYNHSSLEVGDSKFDLNARGGCYFNSHNVYELVPGGSFAESQWITAYNLNALEIGMYPISLSVPLVQDTHTTYRVDGRSFVENEEYLIFKGRTQVVRTRIDERRRKRKK